MHVTKNHFSFDFSRELGYEMIYACWCYFLGAEFVFVLCLLHFCIRFGEIQDFCEGHAGKARSSNWMIMRRRVSVVCQWPIVMIEHYCEQKSGGFCSWFGSDSRKWSLVLPTHHHCFQQGLSPRIIVITTMIMICNWILHIWFDL